MLTVQISERFAEQLCPSLWLSRMGLDTAVQCYNEQHSHMPTTLLIGPWLLMDAYRLMAEYPTKFAVVVVPGMANRWWALVGPGGMVWSFYE